MKRRERGKVEARVEICWGPIKKPGRREDGRGEEVEGREEVRVKELRKWLLEGKGGVKR